MSILAMELTKEPLIGNAGLLAVEELLRISGIDDVCTHRKSANRLVAEKDILRSLCGLISIGKTGFDHIRQHKDDAYFSEALGIMHHAVRGHLAPSLRGHEPGSAGS